MPSQIPTRIGVNRWTVNGLLRRHAHPAGFIQVDDKFEAGQSNIKSNLALDFLQTPRDYRIVRVNYLNLIGSDSTGAAQMNLAAGREALP